MKQLIFSTQIKASKEKVWEMLWSDRTYRIWTSVFSEGSHVKSDWKEGGKILFLSGSGEGMYSIIEKNRPSEFMSFKHLGVIKDGKEMPPDDETKKWSGSMENYTLTETNGYTKLDVEIEMVEELQDYFDQQFPKALEKLKALAEE